MNETRSAYKTADMLMASDLKNALMDRLIESLHHDGTVINFNGIDVLEKANLLHTKLGLFILKSCARAIVTTEHDLQGLENVSGNPEAMAVLFSMVRHYVKEPWSELTLQHKCEYHDHADGEKCQTGDK